MAERRATLRAALGLALLEPHTRELELLTRYDGRGWRATFYTTGMEHSATSSIGTAWEPTPWRAVQRAAGEALARSHDQ